MILPTVAIVIPTRNRTGFLKRCLSKLLPYVSSHPECSITVSDDGDASVTREALGGEMGIVQVIQGPRRGPAANRNCGAAHSTGELLVFLDDDCIPEENLIEIYQDAARKSPEIGVFEGRISATGKAKGFADGCPGNETGGYLWSCNFAIRRELFNRIHGFDDRFPFAAVEDYDLHFRVKQLSPVLFLRDARVWHGYERRAGWKAVKHLILSDLLFLHIHGLEATHKTPLYCIRMAVRDLLVNGSRCLRAGTVKDPGQLVFRFWAYLQESFIILFWRYRVSLARLFYPPCCPGCESIHSVLAAHDSPAEMRKPT